MASKDRLGERPPIPKMFGIPLNKINLFCCGDLAPTSRPFIGGFPEMYVLYPFQNQDPFVIPSFGRHPYPAKICLYWVQVYLFCVDKSKTWSDHVKAMVQPLQLVRIHRRQEVVKVALVGLGRAGHFHMESVLQLPGLKPSAQTKKVTISHHFIPKSFRISSIGLGHRCWHREGSAHCSRKRSPGCKAPFLWHTGYRLL